MRKLDRSRPCQEIYPPGQVAYIQDGIEFDVNGNEVMRRAPEPPAPAAPAAPRGTPANPLPHIDEIDKMSWQELRRCALELAIPNHTNLTRKELEAVMRERLAAAGAPAGEEPAP